MELKRIDVLSCTKIVGILYAAIGFVAGALTALLTMVGVIGSAAADASGSPADLPIAGFLVGAGAVVCAPVVYGLIGAIFGAVGAALYNLVARTIGGIRFEMGETS